MSGIESSPRGEILDDHPIVQRLRSKEDTIPPAITAAELRQMALDAGADDAGVVEIERPSLADEKPHIHAVFPAGRTLVSLVVRMNREPVRSPNRSLANLEFHNRGHHVDDVARTLVARLEERGIRAINPAMGFPMDVSTFPGRLWVVSHKLVAEEAGMGVRGIHRSIIHPRFGSFILLGTIIIDAEVASEATPLDYDPCVKCKLCVAACPVGAIASDGHFDFSACYTHNYREFMGGFTDWVETVVDSKTSTEYRQAVEDDESVSVWQSLSYGPNYKAAYCLAVCPAGEDVMRPFLEDRRTFLSETVKPLQAKEENVYVIPGSDAEAFVSKRYPHKTPRLVGGSLRPTSIAGFLRGILITFQRGQAIGIDTTYHLSFTGREPTEATVVIRDQTIRVTPGHEGKAQFHLTADGDAWLLFLRGDLSLPKALITGKIRFKGSPKRLLEFARCFPS